VVYTVRAGYAKIAFILSVSTNLILRDSLLPIPREQEEERPWERGCVSTLLSLTAVQ